jgi:hypothetical protein
MKSCMTVDASLWTFIAITMLQVFSFIFAPQIAGDMTKGQPEYLQIIGIKEISLLMIYYAILQSKKTNLALMTVCGRLATIPLMVYLIVVVGAPLDTIWGIIIDLFCGTWTLLATQVDPVWTQSGCQKTQYKRSTFSFILLAFLGTVEAVLGILAFFAPTTFLTFDFFRPVNHVNTLPPHLPLRSYGLMSFLTGSYQVYMAAQPCLPQNIWTSVCQFHLLFVINLPVISVCFLAKQGDLAFFAPMNHLVAVALIACFNAVRQPPHITTNTRKD